MQTFIYTIVAGEARRRYTGSVSATTLRAARRRLMNEYSDVVEHWPDGARVGAADMNHLSISERRAQGATSTLVEPAILELRANA